MALPALSPAISDAFEFTINTNGLHEDLRGTSLLTPLSEPTSTATAQDVVAAAQADYARLVGVLYDRGYFAPQVSILIDGREAPTLSLVQPIKNVRNVEIRVTTGAPFKFGTARMSPLPSPFQLVPPGPKLTFHLSQPCWAAV